MNLYVGNLNFDVREEDIKILFEEVGDVSNVKLMLDRETGRSKGFAFVEMKDTEEAIIAMKTLNGREFHGRNIAVNEGVRSDKPNPGFRPGGDRPRPAGGGGFNRDSRPGGGYRSGGSSYPRSSGTGSGDRRPRTNDTRKPFEGNRDTSRPYNRDSNRDSNRDFNRDNQDSNRPSDKDHDHRDRNND
ncbi:MAG: RNA-binding protein [Saprospiraceae bacterium]|nr:RNA-binding protein [Saprospiraceae bacterium]